MGLFDSDVQSSKPLYYVKVISKWLEFPVFRITSASTGDIVTKKIISWNLTGVEYTENVYEWKTIKGFRLSLDSSDGFALVSFGFTSMSRSIYNCLLSLQNGDNISFAPYRKKGTNFDNCSVSQHGKKVEWKFNPKTDSRLQPDYLKDSSGNDAIIDGRKVSNWDKVNDFLTQEMKNKFIGTGFQFAKTSDNYVAPQATQVAHAEEELPDMHESPWSEEAPVA